jgi:hypothetical protein
MTISERNEPKILRASSYRTSFMNSLVKYVSNSLILDPGYPAAIQVPHVWSALCTYRTSFSDSEWNNLPYSQKIIAPFFCHAYGGSTFRDMLACTPPSILANGTVGLYYLYSWIIFAYTPGDLVFKYWMEQKPFHLGIEVVDALDQSCGLCSAFEKGTALFPKNPVAPFVLAIANSSIGGATFRYFERKGRNLPLKVEWMALTNSIGQSLLYALLYSFIRKKYNKNGYNWARLTLCWFHMLKTCFIHFCDIHDPVKTGGQIFFEFLNSLVQRDTFKRNGLIR